MKRRKNIVIAIVLLLILCVSIGYAALTDTFKIKGTTNITGNTWSLTFDNLQVDTTTSNVTATTAPHIVTGTASDTYTQQVEYEVTLSKPQDIYLFSVDLKNNGSVDAEVASVSVSGLTANAANYIEYVVVDTTDPSNPKDADTGDVIAAGQKKTYTVATSYMDVTNDVLEQYAGSAVTLTLTFEVNLVQHV